MIYDKQITLYDKQIKQKPALTLQQQQIERFDVFLLARKNFEEWLRVWRMAVSERKPNNKDLSMFARENKANFTDLFEQKIQKLKSVKV